MTLQSRRNFQTIPKSGKYNPKTCITDVINVVKTTLDVEVLIFVKKVIRKNSVSTLPMGTTVIRSTVVVHPKMVDTQLWCIRGLTERIGDT